MRDKVSKVLEACILLSVVGWMIWLFHDAKDTGSTRSTLELIALAGLSFWPLVRNRIKHGFWP